MYVWHTRTEPPQLNVEQLLIKKGKRSNVGIEVWPEKILDKYTSVYFSITEESCIELDVHDVIKFASKRYVAYYIFEHERENEFDTRFSSFVLDHVLCKVENDAVP